MSEPAPTAVNLRAIPGIGTELGPYRIVQVLGAGGMGQVFLAEHKKLGRRVALKLLLPQFASNPEVIGRFFHEARAVNQINHAHIVEIFDFVEEPGGFNYFIMEFLEGCDLATSRDDGGPFSIERTVRIARQIASALTATHGHGIVHRDLKPENIYLVQRDELTDFVKILDFGIAKLVNTDVEARPRTRAGVILGTPEYMSPEQGGGQAVDQRSDLYSLGIILYWMVTDELPFRGESMGEILVKQLTETPPALPETSASGEPVPLELERAIARCLEREPTRRLQSAVELLEILAPIQIGGATPFVPRRARSRTIPFAVAGAALFLAAAAGGIHYWSSGPQRSAASPVATAVATPSPRPALPPLQPPPPTPSPRSRRAEGESRSAASGEGNARNKSEPNRSAAHSKTKRTSVRDGHEGMINPFEE